MTTSAKAQVTSGTIHHAHPREFSIRPRKPKGDVVPPDLPVNLGKGGGDQETDRSVSAMSQKEMVFSGAINCGSWDNYKIYPLGSSPWLFKFCEGFFCQSGMAFRTKLNESGSSPFPQKESVSGQLNYADHDHHFHAAEGANKCLPL